MAIQCINPADIPPAVDKDQIHIDVNLIPEWTRDRLCAATLDFIKGILRQPGGKEMLDAETARRHAAQAAEKGNKKGPAGCCDHPAGL